VTPQADRAAVLAGLQAVDYVVIFDELTPERLIRTLRPDVLMKSADWAGRGVAGREFVEASGGRVHLIPLREGYSTTSLIERIRGGRQANRSPELRVPSSDEARS
jgi:rfaE bifunctional protein nucleotidyltransferase chain/domain